MAAPTVGTLTTRAQTTFGTISITVDATSGYAALWLAVLWEDSGTDREVTAFVDSSGSPQAASFVRRAAVTSGNRVGVEVWRIDNPASVNTTWTPTWSGGTRPNRCVTSHAVLVSASGVHAHAGASNASGSSIGASLETTVPECLLLDFGIAAVVTANPSASSGQSVLYNSQNGDGSEGHDPFVGSSVATTAGTGKSHGWSMSAAGSVAQVLVAIEPDTPPEPNPKIETLVEPFDGSEVPATFAATNTGSSTIAVSDGAAHFTRAGIFDQNRLDSVDPYDLTGSAIVVELGDLVDTYMNVALWSGANEIRLRTHDGYLSYVITGLGFDDYEVAYDPVAHRRWRIREDSGTVYLEVAAATGSFTTLGSYDVGDIDATITALTVRIHSDADTGLFSLYGINVVEEEGVEAAGDATITVTASASAAAGRESAGSAAVALSSAATATRHRVAAVAAALALSVSATPVVVRGAQADATVAVTASAAPVRGRPASASAALTITTTATPVASRLGGADASIAVTASAQASRERLASAAAGVGLAVSAQPVRHRLASATAATALTATANAAATRLAGADATIDLTATAAPQVEGTITAGADAAITVTASVSPAVHRQSAAHAAIGLTVSATPQVSGLVTAAADASVAVTSDAAPVRGRVASGAAAIAITTAAEPVVIPAPGGGVVTAAAEAAIGVTVSASPAVQRVAAATATIAVTVSATPASDAAVIVPLVTTTITDYHRVRTHQGAAYDTIVTHGPLYRVRTPE